MSFPWSYSVLGLVPGLILTVVVAAIVLYTSLIIWYASLSYVRAVWVLIPIRRFCLRHPEVRDVCDIGQYLFWDSRIAWYMTAVMFLLNNTFIQVITSLLPYCHISAQVLILLGLALLGRGQISQHNDESWSVHYHLVIGDCHSFHGVLAATDV